MTKSAFDRIMAGLQDALAMATERPTVGGHPVLVDRSSDGTYGVSFPELPGCVAMGRTREEALENAATALRDWEPSDQR